VLINFNVLTTTLRHHLGLSKGRLKLKQATQPPSRPHFNHCIVNTVAVMWAVPVMTAVMCVVLCALCSLRQWCCSTEQCQVDCQSTLSSETTSFTCIRRQWFACLTDSLWDWDVILVMSSDMSKAAQSAVIICRHGMLRGMAAWSQQFGS